MLKNAIQEVKEHPIRSFSGIALSIGTAITVDKYLGISDFYSETYSGLTSAGVPTSSAILLSIWVIVLPVIVISLMAKFFYNRTENEGESRAN